MVVGDTSAPPPPGYCRGRHHCTIGEPVTVPDDTVPESGGGAHEAKSGALRGYTDQFEVLKMPRRPA